MPPRRSKAKPKATEAEPVDEEDDGMSEDEASSSDMPSVAVRVYAEDDGMSEDEADGEDSKEESSESGAEETDGEESKEEAAEKEMDAGADETKAEEMDAEPEANGGADADKTKVEAADAKVEAEEQAAAAADGGSGVCGEEAAETDDEDEEEEAAGEEAAEAGGEIEEDWADSETPLPPRRRRRRKAGERGDSPPPVPDNLRCRRSDGKKWRCAARALPTVSFCEYHYAKAIMGKKPPADGEFLAVALQRLKKNKRSFCEYHYAKASKGKKPPANGELLAVALQRLKKNKMKGRRRLNLTPESPKATKDLPNGFMTISPRSSGAVGSPVTTKVGVDIPAPIRWCYCSKNADPVPVGPVKVVLRAMSKAKEAQMSCHRCGLKKVARVVKCNNCENNCFCNRCINKWYSGISRKDMKMKCPVCHGSCDCKRCTLGQTKGAMHKESPSDLGRRRLNLTPESPKATKDLPNGFMTVSLGSSGAVCSPVMTKVGVDSVQANDYSIKRCISALTATTLAPDEKIKASEVFQILANRETFLSFNETDPEIALLWLRGKVDKL